MLFLSPSILVLAFAFGCCVWTDLFELTRLGCGVDMLSMDPLKITFTALEDTSVMVKDLCSSGQVIKYLVIVIRISTDCLSLVMLRTITDLSLSVAGSIFGTFSLYVFILLSGLCHSFSTELVFSDCLSTIGCLSLSLSLLTDLYTDLNAA